MSVDPVLPDDELLVLARTGDREAASALVDRHLDSVYDHLARWSQDSALAATATIEAVTALFDPSEPLPDTGVRTWLLAAGRTHAIDHLRTGDAPEASRFSPAVLAATGPSPQHGGHESAMAVWTAASSLDDHRFTVLDLTVRQGLDDAQVATVTGDEVEDVVDARERIDRGLAGSAPDPLAVYASLARLAAPVAVRNGVAAVLTERVGPLPASWPLLARQLAVGAVAVGGVLTLIGVASALRADPIETEPPPSVVAEVMEDLSPSPSPSPTPGATLAPLESPSPSPTPAPSPTPTPSPTPSPSATPSPEPATPVAVTLDSPATGTAVLADDVDELGREVGVLNVAATASGPEGFLVRWSTDLDPDVALLEAEDGSVALWLADPCQDTAHPLRVTVTDPATGESATEVTDVVARHTCAAPLDVRIEAPADGASMAITGVDGEGRPVAEFNASATPGQDDGITWTWTSDEQPGEVLLDRSSGTVQLTNSTCSPITHLLTVDALRDSDGSGGSDSISVTVEPAPGCIP